MNEELRCYTFTHFMLSSIQQGIQSGHAAVELFNKYDNFANGNPVANVLWDWAKNDKTMVCLNGGNSKALRELYSFLDVREVNPFPYSTFNEDEESFENVLTSIAIVLPARIFETAGLMRRRTLPDGVSYTHDKILGEHRFSWTNELGSFERGESYSEWEYELMVLLNSHGLAR